MAKKKAPEQPKRNVEPQSAATIAPKEAEVLSGDIDSRMAALLKDHQAMGARK